MAVAVYSISATSTRRICRRLNPTTELGRSGREEGSGRKLRLAQAVQGTYYGFRIRRRRRRQVLFSLKLNYEGILNAWSDKGLALLVNVPRDKNIAAEAMMFLNIPKGV